MKISALFLCLFCVVGSAFADGGQKIIERKTCEQIKSEIATLSAVTNPTAEQQQDLAMLTSQQRANCSARGTGRRTSLRNNTQIVTKEVATTSGVDILDEYLSTKQANCDKLNAEIVKLTPDPKKEYLVVEMKKYYDVDCAKPDENTTEVIAQSVEDFGPVKTEEEIAAEFDANLAAGLCGDGTKPNKYGCCVDEIFRDMGNSVFACCPKTGGDCFPPIK